MLTNLIIIFLEDVHWIWHAHMLAPVPYKKDMQTVFGRVVNHSSTMSPTSHHINVHRGSKIWNEMWPDEPYEVDESKFDAKFKSKFDYDIASAVQRQISFFYQVSLPHYQEENFLGKGLIRYKMYLYLKSMYQEEFLVPCYDIDLFWHAHQLKPLEYKKDTETIIGFHLPHDDSVNDRSQGSKLCSSQEITEKLWSEIFGPSETFQCIGAMFRGEPPIGKLWHLTKDFQENFVKGDHFVLALTAHSNPHHIQGEVEERKNMRDEIKWKFPSKAHFNKKPVARFPDPEKGEIYMNVEIKSNHNLWEGKTEVSHKVNRMQIKNSDLSLATDDSEPYKNTIEFGMPVGKSENSPENISTGGTKQNSNKCTVQENIDVSFLFDISQQKMSTSCFCIQQDKPREIGNWINTISYEQIGNFCKNLNLFSGEFDAVDNNQNTKYKHRKNRGTLTVPLTVERLTNRKVWKKLTVKPRYYYDCAMPENVQSLWGPVALRRLPVMISTRDTNNIYDIMNDMMNNINTRGVDNTCKAAKHE